MAKVRRRPTAILLRRATARPLGEVRQGHGRRLQAREDAALILALMTAIGATVQAMDVLGIITAIATPPEMGSRCHLVFAGAVALIAIGHSEKAGLVAA